MFWMSGLVLEGPTYLGNLFVQHSIMFSLSIYCIDICNGLRVDAVKKSALC